MGIVSPEPLKSMTLGGLSSFSSDCMRNSELRAGADSEASLKGSSAGSGSTHGRASIRLRALTSGKTTLLPYKCPDIPG